MDLKQGFPHLKSSFLLLLDSHLIDAIKELFQLLGLLLLVLLLHLLCVLLLLLQLLLQVHSLAPVVVVQHHDRLGPLGLVQGVFPLAAQHLLKGNAVELVDRHLVGMRGVVVLVRRLARC